MKKYGGLRSTHSFALYNSDLSGAMQTIIYPDRDTNFLYSLSFLAISLLPAVGLSHGENKNLRI